VQSLPGEGPGRNHADTCSSKSQYETQLLKKWKFRKYSKKEEWFALLHALDSRKTSGKKTDVYFDGELVSEDRIQKERVRYRKYMENHPDTQGMLLARFPESVDEREGYSFNRRRSAIPQCPH
jgi:hypothetical protein